MIAVVAVGPRMAHHRNDRTVHTGRIQEGHSAYIDRMKTAADTVWEHWAVAAAVAEKEVFVRWADLAATVGPAVVGEVEGYPLDDDHLEGRCAEAAVVDDSVSCHSLLGAFPIFLLRLDVDSTTAPKVPGVLDVEKLAVVAAMVVQVM